MKKPGWCKRLEIAIILLPWNDLIQMKMIIQVQILISNAFHFVEWVLFKDIGSV